MNCTNQQPPQRGDAFPNPVWLGRNGCWPSRGSQLSRDSPHTNHFFAVLPLNYRRRAARSFFKIGLLSSLFPCLSLAHLLILLLVLISGNVHPNPYPIFPCSLCAENVTWRGRSVQCCTCSKWVHLKCSLLSFSRFRTLGRSHSWSCPSCCIYAFSRDSIPTNTVTSSSNSSSLYTSTAQSGPFGPSVNAALPPNPRL